MTDEPAIREPEQIRCDCARKLRSVQVSDHFAALELCARLSIDVPYLPVVSPGHREE